jgi:pimeloyl-ACP methyl ester carboxylesterase
MNARWQKILVLGWLLASAAWLAWAWPRSLALALGGWAIAASTSLAWLGLQFVLMRRINRRDATPAAGRWALLRAWWLEALTCTWVFGWLQPFAHRQQPDWLPSTPTGQRGVVLVHGFLCNRGVWLPWLPELRARGHAYVALTLEPAFGSVDDYVAAIDTAMRQVQAATGLPPVLVGHSMGGLAARAWLRTQAQPPAQRVHRILTLGTPHHGTWPARFSHTTNGMQMRLDSPWLQALAASEGAAQRALFSCWYSDCDNIVYPTRSATLDGADNHLLQGLGHVHMVYAPQVRAACWQALQTGPGSAVSN